MDNQKLDELLEGFFNHKEIEADAKLVYEARQRLEGIEKKKKQKEYMKSLIYVVLLHILWTSIMVGSVFLLKGGALALQVLLKNLLLSSFLIIAGCIGLPYLNQLNKEEKR